MSGMSISTEHNYLVASRTSKLKEKMEEILENKEDRIMQNKAMTGRGGRPLGKIRIVDRLLDRDEVLKEEWNVWDLCIALDSGNKLRVLEWMATRRLIKNEWMCPSCTIGHSRAMKLQNRSILGDRYVWRCNSCLCTRTVRDDSFFAKSKLKLQTLLRFVNCWSLGFSQQACAFQSGLGPICTGTSVDWSSFCRNVCECWLEEHSCEVGGLDENGIPKEVEILQSKFISRKQYLGLWEENHWVLGGLDRGSSKCFLVEVPDKTVGTLTSIIRKTILPGSIIVSEGWLPREEISALDGGIYDYQIKENLWMDLKRKIKKKYPIKEELYPSYLHEFLWRETFKQAQYPGRLFNVFITCLWDIYSFD